MGDAATDVSPFTALIFMVIIDPVCDPLYDWVKHHRPPNQPWNAYYMKYLFEYLQSVVNITPEVCLIRGRFPPT